MQGLPVQCKLGYLGASESLVVYPLPGSTVIQEYMDSTKDWRMNYEFAMKSKSQQSLHDTLWKLQSKLDHLNSVESSNDSFEFQKLRITDTPFIGNIDEQGWTVFLLSIQAEITIYGE